ncbi:hypothetical protein SDC9_191275 [bioreactor metagenome]|uniref:Uncharacterized protein n=1 Tax=bioreactor metagenome TaxID=1076179 RepID=A0A645HXF5_9ZZZZ
MSHQLAGARAVKETRNAGIDARFLRGLGIVPFRSGVAFLNNDRDNVAHCCRLFVRDT